MARQGKPIPFSQREEIRKRVSDGESRRSVARDLKLNKDTVGKYSRKRS